MGPNRPRVGVSIQVPGLKEETKNLIERILY
jgi:hypothetical protein